MIYDFCKLFISILGLLIELFEYSMWADFINLFILQSSSLYIIS